MGEMWSPKITDGPSGRRPEHFRPNENNVLKKRMRPKGAHP